MITGGVTVPGTSFSRGMVKGGRSSRDIIWQGNGYWGVAVPGASVPGWLISLLLGPQHKRVEEIGKIQKESLGYGQRR